MALFFASLSLIFRGYEAGLSMHIKQLVPVVYVSTAVLPGFDHKGTLPLTDFHLPAVNA